VRQAKASARVVGQSLLVLLALAGVAAVSVVAPNIFAAVGRLGGRRRFFEKPQLQKAVAYLKKKRYVRGAGDGRYGYQLEITKEGALVMLSHSLKELRIKPMPQWDGYWRIVIFDIPNRHKWSRDTLRRQLKTMEFYPLQESVFVSRYPCDEEIKFLCTLLNITDYVRLITTREVLPDDDLKKFFSVE
jgi:DNA-binding transcriptional regulator PaaX